MNPAAVAWLEANYQWCRCDNLIADPWKTMRCATCGQGVTRVEPQPSFS